MVINIHHSHRNHPPTVVFKHQNLRVVAVALITKNNNNQVIAVVLLVLSMMVLQLLFQQQRLLLFNYVHVPSIAFGNNSGNRHISFVRFAFAFTIQRQQQQHLLKTTISRIRHRSLTCLGYSGLLYRRLDDNGIYKNTVKQSPFQQRRQQPSQISIYPISPSHMPTTCLRRFATNEIDFDKENSNEITDDTDLYEYGNTEESSQWMVPSRIDIPEDKIAMKFVRSSGAGGQNVNKVSSCVQIRFHVLSAEWMGPLEVRQRFASQYSNAIGKHDGMYRNESQVYRTQSDNRKDVLQKLQAAVLAVWPRPKARKLRVGLSERGKQKRKEEKSKQSTKKEGRRNNNQPFDF